jgi:hypothetical protein
MPERTGFALLHWIDPQEDRPLFYSHPITMPPDVNGFVALCKAARARALGPVALAGIQGNRPLPVQLAAKEAAVRQTEQFRSDYEQWGVSFASVPLADLITPQWWVDLEYVNDLVAAVPAAGDDNALFDFCFATGRLGPPMLVGMNGVVIKSGRRDLGTISPLRIEAVAPDKVTFGFDALPRANWVWLNVIKGGEMVILNGVHHLLALMRAGRNRAYCLLRQGLVEQVLDFQTPGIFKPQHLTARRPPLLRDYLDAKVADSVRVRAVDQFMRFVVQSPPEIGFVPQG